MKNRIYFTCYWSESQLCHRSFVSRRAMVSGCANSFGVCVYVWTANACFSLIQFGMNLIINAFELLQCLLYLCVLIFIYQMYSFSFMFSLFVFVSIAFTSLGFTIVFYYSLSWNFLHLMLFSNAATKTIYLIKDVNTGIVEYINLGWYLYD